MAELCKPEECNCDYSWSDCDLTNKIEKAKSQLREQIAQEIEAAPWIYGHSDMLKGDLLEVAQQRFANIARGK